LCETLSPKTSGMLMAFYSGGYDRAGADCLCGWYHDPSGSSSSRVGWWGHVCWDCPYLYNVRREHGFPGEFLRLVDKYKGTPLFETGIIDDYMYMTPLPAVPAITRWRTRHFRNETLFSGACFGDGSVIGGSVVVSSRAGWSVIQLSSDTLPAVPFIEMWGTLPGPVQTISGAELFGLLSWLRNLDPSCGQHFYYTDSAWVFSGWHGGVFEALAHSTPFRDLWAEVLSLRSEWTVGALVVRKTRSHLSEAAVSHSLVLQWERAGNGFADTRAKHGALLHPSMPSLKERHDRATKLVLCLAKYFAVVLNFVSKHELLPSRPPQPFKVPALPSHSVAIGPGGSLRCVRCFRIAGTSGRVAGDCVVRQAVPHHPLAIGHGIFCAVCGAYSFRRTVRMSGACPRRPTNLEVTRRLANMLAGRHPVTGTWIETPHGALLPGDLFSLEL
jgi:hypothetical protein